MYILRLCLCLENQIFRYLERYKKPPFRTIIQFLIPPSSPLKTPFQTDITTVVCGKASQIRQSEAQISEPYLPYICMSIVNHAALFPTRRRSRIYKPKNCWWFGIYFKHPFQTDITAVVGGKASQRDSNRKAQISEPYLPYICMGPVNHAAQSPTRRRSRIYKPKNCSSFGFMGLRMADKGQIWRI
ncbi:hypothetical protein CDAR_122701 [Caerostris darwini]|uniref:Uncharacterized protein n=1 Tax=Caerostris darwini TaxID=1538125 RepID=A0AAV4UZH1_9ARAC|nr:hypothetical protein CDAR_122701 [Caerostris darwini]